MNLRSLTERASRFVRRKLRNLSGPRLTSVQSVSESAFARKFRDNAALNKEQSTEAFMSRFLSDYGDRWRDAKASRLPQLTDLRLDLERMSDAQIIEKADAALNGDIHPSGVRPVFHTNGQIDWNSNPAESREWLLMIHRHAWWTLWGVAYQKTEDERYAKAFVRQLVDWIDRNPMPGRKSENLEAWRLMEVGLRARVSWIPAFRLFFDSPAFDVATKIKMLRSFYDHGQMLYTFFTNRNHLVRESNGLLALGLNFPEFHDSGKWIDTASTRIDNELANQINDDGSQIEMSVGYQWLSVDEFYVTYKMLCEHDRALPTQNIEVVLGKMAEHLGIVSRPDGSFPQLNDGFILWDQNDLAALGQDLGNSTVEYIASAGRRGSMPDFLSRSLPNAGLHVMRSDWSEMAHWSIFDTGPYGGPHGHEDKLSFEIFAGGVPFIVDPGSYTYNNKDPYRDFFVSSRGHNTVLVDGCSQVRRWGDEHILPAVDSTHHGQWRSDPNVDYASGTYTDGYAPFSMRKPDGVLPLTDIVHQRDMIYVKQKFWIVVDYLDSEIPHNYEFLFHLSPDISTTSKSGGPHVLQSGVNDAKMLLHPITHSKLSCAVIEGAEAPIQGWYSTDHHKKQPSPALDFSASAEGGFMIAWVFYPLASGTLASSVDVATAEPTGNGELEFKIVLKDQVSTVTIRDKYAPNTVGISERSSDILIVHSEGERHWQVQCRG